MDAPQTDEQVEHLGQLTAHTENALEKFATLQLVTTQDPELAVNLERLTHQGAIFRNVTATSLGVATDAKQYAHSIVEYLELVMEDSTLASEFKNACPQLEDESNKIGQKFQDVSNQYSTIQSDVAEVNTAINLRTRDLQENLLEQEQRQEKATQKAAKALSSKKSGATLIGVGTALAPVGVAFPPVLVLAGAFISAGLVGTTVGGVQGLKAAIRREDSQFAITKINDSLDFAQTLINVIDLIQDLLHHYAQFWQQNAALLRSIKYGMPGDSINRLVLISAIRKWKKVAGYLDQFCSLNLYLDRSRRVQPALTAPPPPGVNLIV